MLSFLTSLYFVKLWQEVAGFTVRLKDIVIVILLSMFFTPTLLHKKLRYHSSRLYKPVFVWAAIFLVGVVVTLVSPLDAEVNKDAVFNSVWLALALSLFFQEQP